MRWFRSILVVIMSCVVQFALAQDSDSPTIYQQITVLANNYKAEKSVKSMVCDGGVMLKTVKMMLRKDFGKEFIDNINAFAIIVYKDAKKEVADRILREIEAIASPLQQINIDDKVRAGAKARGFVQLTDDKTKLTDLLIISETPAPKLIYFKGSFAPENIDYKK